MTTAEHEAVTKVIDYEGIGLQRLPTGHFAPVADTEVAANTAKLMHIGQMVHGTELAKIPAGSLVIDCGAFIGDTALDFQSHGWRVIAFEPYLDNYLCLTLNSPKSINIMAAVGNGNYQRKDYTCPGNNHGMRQVFDDPHGVPSFRLDDLPVSERVAFIKIDVEGCELFVLEGARKLIAKDSPVLWMEVFPEKLHNHSVSVEAVQQELNQLGYGIVAYGSAPRWECYCSKDIPVGSIYP